MEDETPAEAGDQNAEVEQGEETSPKNDGKSPMSQAKKPKSKAKGKRKTDTRKSIANPAATIDGTISNENKFLNILTDEDKSAQFWIQKVRQLQEDIRRAQTLAQTYDLELTDCRAKMKLMNVQFSSKMQEIQREQYEKLIRQNIETEQRVSIEYEKKIDNAYTDMKKSYDETVESDARKIHQHLSDNEQLRQELAQLHSKNNELSKSNQFLLKELGSKTTDRTKKFREETLAEAQKSVEFHRQVSQEAVKQAREQRHMMQMESIKSTHTMEETSSKFEHQLHTATVKAIDRYRSMAKQAMDTASTERKKAREILIEKEESSSRQRTEFEGKMNSEVTQRLNAYKDDVKKLEKETSQMRGHYDKLVQEILTQIQQEAIQFENETKRKALSVVEYYKKQAEDTKKALDTERQQNLRRQMRLMDAYTDGQGGDPNDYEMMGKNQVSMSAYGRGGSISAARSSRSIAPARAGGGASQIAGRAGR